MAIPNPPQGGYNPPALPGSASYTPDYMALIQSDPTYKAIADQIHAQGITDQAQRQAATMQALIGYGQIPDFAATASQLGLSPDALAMLQADIDPNAAALAGQNTSAGLSTTAQLAQQQQQQIQALRNSLAARGALGSGDDAYRTGLQNQAYAKAENDALNSLLAAINGYQGTYLNAQNAENAQLNTAMTNAETLEAGLPQNQGFSLTYNAKRGVYTDSAGNTYTVHNNNDGTWMLTNSATGARYMLDSKGNLTNYSGAFDNPAPPNTGFGHAPGTTPPVPNDWNPGPINTGFGHNNPFGTTSPINTDFGHANGFGSQGPINTGFGHDTGFAPGPINLGFGHDPNAGNNNMAASMAALNPPLGQPLPIPHPHLPNGRIGIGHIPAPVGITPPKLPTPAI